MSSVFIKGLTKKYEQGANALSSFNLEVTDGELVVLAGPTGSGKSTALRLISGYETPTAGDIIINGILVNDIPVSSRNIAMVLKNQSLYPSMTVRENLEFSLKLCYTSVGEISKRIEGVMAIMGVENLLDVKAGELDETQNMKIILLRAAVRRPRVLLVDMPFSRKSKTLREECCAFLLEMNKKLKVTMIIATKDRKMLQSIPYKTVIIKDGYIQQTDMPKYIYENPMNLFVAEFISFPNMESAVATLNSDANGYFLKTETHTIYLDKEKVEAGKAAQYVGKNVLVGLRQEAVKRISKEENGIDAIVRKIEDTVYGEAAVLESGDISIPILNADGFSDGEIVKISFIPNQIMLFDNETEKKIY